ncbi:hypothetical protein ANN_09344 [Periplaneta americana]|uniref:Uncharacterized protein n=1 Tax=Periplaneta americana TaxID=6978 RepID=A0ABQ8TL59_PERAM|nr:hypothetical protein ANN_09344 [Periplaneta americana]
MAGLCEGGNEPPGSLKANFKDEGKGLISFTDTYSVRPESSSTLSPIFFSADAAAARDTDGDGSPFKGRSVTKEGAKSASENTFHRQAKDQCA